jgi:hypothetical protein
MPMFVDWQTKTETTPEPIETTPETIPETASVA